MDTSNSSPVWAWRGSSAIASPLNKSQKPSTRPKILQQVPKYFNKSQNTSTSLKILQQVSKYFNKTQTHSTAPFNEDVVLSKRGFRPTPSIGCLARACQLCCATNFKQASARQPAIRYVQSCETGQYGNTAYSVILHAPSPAPAADNT
jgi:hypothetical protein